jgi:DhnA family fructose-bisphosphate aldolase class Ia
MSEIGKEIRLRRILKEDGRTIIIPMEGLVPGWDKLCEKITAGGVDAVMPTYGIAKRYYRTMAGKVPFVLSIPTDIRYAHTAVRMGADMVKITYFVPWDYREVRTRLRDEVHPFTDECDKLGMPTLVEIVPINAGKTGLEFYDLDVEHIKQAVNLGSSLGGDLMKTSYTGDIDSFKEVVKESAIPVTILGGPSLGNDRKILQTIKDMLTAGGVGICFGRNTTRHKNPEGISRAYVKVIHENASVDEALKELK